ncbi:DUF2513 domain-containing protein [Burkholderia multivorans]|uniref:Bacteriophage protein n=1 Tax=Burkholderia multivorans (strain ATCC 17616 / 249) TaxID=395019 RepID=A0A0H3KSD3_BURM1|nr:DUF2513 domain-containing protein [Burkholderia phage Bcep176]ABA60019.1 gp18 [Burkholderia phage Bcep176]PRF62437.1 DUF2513 domain-containing protein [Burkholderia multivorans]BAG46507.1 bacteriophage protein [Burkholderia multivorans ATCC 17616]
MKRDMDIVRRIALAAEDLQYGYHLTGLDDVAPEVFGIHVIWMKEAGLVHAHVSEYLSPLDDPPDASVIRLTWSGCEFVDAARSDTIWNKAKTTLIKPAASFSFQILREWLAAEIKQGLPTLRG